MKITSIQKVIKVGSSLAVTIPARDAKSAHLVAGSEVKSTVEIIDTTPNTGNDLTAEYEAFKKQYSATLKNLADR